MNHLEIRRVKEGDESVLAYIQTESWKEAFKEILSKEDLEQWTNRAKSEAMYKELLKNHIGHGVILQINGKPHCIAFWDNTREPDMQTYAELICIHSLCENWGHGYGSVVMEHILSEMKEAGFHNVMLWVFEQNIRARRFYEKHEFVASGKLKPFLNTSEVMYCKSL